MFSNVTTLIASIHVGTLNSACFVTNTVQHHESCVPVELVSRIIVTVLQMVVPTKADI